MLGDRDSLDKQLEVYFQDDSITDLLWVGHSRFVIDRNGRLESRESPFQDGESFFSYLEKIIVPTGRRWEARYPFLDGALPDGSRFHLVFPPASLHGPILSIRKFRRSSRLALADFIGAKEIRVLEDLRDSVARGENLLVSGGTGVGKTTLLGLLIDSLPRDLRWILVEECPEIVTEAPHVVRLQGRPPTPDGVGEITLRMLVKNSLRMRPDRIVLGECRGAEAFDLLQAMMTGHGGSMGTIHASSALGALARLEALVGLSGTSLSLEAIRLWISQSIRWVVHLDREDGVRKVAELIRVDGLENSRYRVHPWFRIQKLSESR